MDIFLYDGLIIREILSLTIMYASLIQSEIHTFVI